VISQTTPEHDLLGRLPNLPSIPPSLPPSLPRSRGGDVSYLLPVIGGLSKEELEAALTPLLILQLTPPSLPSSLPPPAVATSPTSSPSSVASPKKSSRRPSPPSWPKI